MYFLEDGKNWLSTIPQQGQGTFEFNMKQNLENSQLTTKSKRVHSQNSKPLTPKKKKDLMIKKILLTFTAKDTPYLD